MADTKISALTAVAASAGANEFAVNEAGTSKKASLTQVTNYLQTIGMPRVFQLVNNHVISSTTATEVTGLGPVTLEPLTTHVFTYYIIGDSGTASVGLGLGINFTGVTNKQVWTRRSVCTSATAANGTIDDASGNVHTVWDGYAERTFFTTAPPVNTGGVASINQNVLIILEGVIRVASPGGNLQLWHSSETAASTAVKSNSSLVIIRTA